jgi:hypothetical protein
MLKRRNNSVGKLVSFSDLSGIEADLQMSWLFGYETRGRDRQTWRLWWWIPKLRFLSSEIWSPISRGELMTSPDSPS